MTNKYEAREPGTKPAVWARSGADALSSVPPAAAGLQGEGEQDGGDGWIYAAGWLAGDWLLAIGYWPC